MCVGSENIYIYFFWWGPLPADDDGQPKNPFFPRCKMFHFPMKKYFLLSFFSSSSSLLQKYDPPKKKEKKNLGTIMGTFFALCPAVPCHKSVFDVIYFLGRPSFIFFFE
jgi:hypothetical protein